MGVILSRQNLHIYLFASTSFELSTAVFYLSKTYGRSLLSPSGSKVLEKTCISAGQHFNLLLFLPQAQNHFTN